MSARLVSATRRLAHLLLQRAAAGVSADREAAVRLLDTRLVPTAEDQSSVAREALALCGTATSRLGREDSLTSEFRTNLRIALKDRNDKPFSVVVPSVVLRADGTDSVLVMAPTGDRAAEARARRYRFAVGRLRGRRTEAFLVHPDGTVEKVPG